MNGGTVMQLGLKASTNKDQIDDRLKYHPDVFEFHLTDQDFTTDGWEHFLKMVSYVSDQVPHIVFHHPMKWHDQRCELYTNPRVNPELYEFVIQSAARLIKLAAQTNSYALVHGAYKSAISNITTQWPTIAAAQDAVFNEMERLREIAPEHVVFENGISPVYGYGDPELENRIIQANLPLAFDISHAFIAVHADNDALIESLRHLKPQVKHYHLVDSMGQDHDSLPLGKGLVDWQRVVNELNPTASRIYEINLADQRHCQEMMASHQYLTQIVAEKNNQTLV